MTKGLIFNIQRFSIHDGPGIRTTVFLKGCPLNCPWCANPESKSPSPQLFHTQASCSGCKNCEGVCPQKCITMNGKVFQYHHEQCINCGACTLICPTHALMTEGQWYTVGEVIAEVKKDEAFYQTSGGGVTLSGGEPLLQKEFVLQLLKELRKNHYHANIETTGYTSQEYFKQILPHLDMIYMDFKHPDHEKHQQAVGVGNELIIQNMIQAIQAGIALTIRIPVIPRFNDSLETAKEYGKVLAEIGAKEVQLLPFHQMGQGKWQSMGIAYEYETDKSMKEEELTKIAEILTGYRLNVQLGGT